MALLASTPCPVGGLYLTCNDQLIGHIFCWLTYVLTNFWPRQVYWNLCIWIIVRWICFEGSLILFSSLSSSSLKARRTSSGSRSSSAGVVRVRPTTMLASVSSFRPRTNTTRPSTAWLSDAPTRTSVARLPTPGWRETVSWLPPTVTSCPATALRLDWPTTLQPTALVFSSLDE